MICRLMGFMGNGSETQVTLNQDDATKQYILVIGRDTAQGKMYVESSMINCLTKAGTDIGITINDDPLDPKFI